jgi:hypothetical protein
MSEPASSAEFRSWRFLVVRLFRLSAIAQELDGTAYSQVQPRPDKSSLFALARSRGRRYSPAAIQAKAARRRTVGNKLLSWEKGKNMRKSYWCRTLAFAGVTVMLYFSGVYAGRHPCSFLARCTDMVYRVGYESDAEDHPACAEDGELCAPEEPTKIEDSLPDQPEPVVVMQHFLEWADPGSNVVKDEGLHLIPVPVSPATETAPSAPITVLPPLVDGDSDKYRVMPGCLDEETVPAKVPYVKCADANSPKKSK